MSNVNDSKIKKLKKTANKLYIYLSLNNTFEMYRLLTHS